MYLILIPDPYEYENTFYLGYTETEEQAEIYIEEQIKLFRKQQDEYTNHINLYHTAYDAPHVISWACKRSQFEIIKLDKLI